MKIQYYFMKMCKKKLQNSGIVSILYPCSENFRSCFSGILNEEL